MCARLADLPLEIAGEIFAAAAFQWNTSGDTLSLHRKPLAYLLVNSRIYNYLIPRLYSDLVFTDVEQLSLFSSCKKAVPILPKSICIQLSGATAERRMFVVLHETFLRCLKSSVPEHATQLKLLRLQFRFNSHRFDPNLNYLYRSLLLVEYALHNPLTLGTKRLINHLVLRSPEEFTWSGPDPDHHFSTAIVSEATTMVFRAFPSWSSLRVLVLTNLAFPPHANAEGEGTPGKLTVTDYATLMSSLPAIQNIYLGQVTFLDPAIIANVISHKTCPPRLSKIQLVDAYRGGIWGSRVRLGDIEEYTRRLDGSVEWVESTRRIVHCGAKTERIEGGDRMDQCA